MKKYQNLNKNSKFYFHINNALNELRENPFNKENKLLKGDWKGYRRIKSDGYRVIYEIIFNEELNEYEVNVIKFGSRRNIYIKSGK